MPELRPSYLNTSTSGSPVQIGAYVIILRIELSKATEALEQHGETAGLANLSEAFNNLQELLLEDLGQAVLTALVAGAEGSVEVGVKVHRLEDDVFYPFRDGHL